MSVPKAVSLSIATTKSVAKQQFKTQSLNFVPL